MPFTQTGDDASATISGNFNEENTLNHTTRTNIGGNQNPTYHAGTINVITIGTDLVADPSVHHILQAIAGPPNRAPSQCPLPSWQRWVIAAVYNTFGFIVFIVRFLVGC